MPLIREVLNAQGMSVTMFCGGQSKVGFGISGTWTGTINFAGSVDGVNFLPLPCNPFPSGAAVAGVTGNGNWESPTLNFVAVRATFTILLTGSATVIVGASVDSSYQNAFLAASTIYANANGTAALVTLTQPAQANRAWKLASCVVTLNKQPNWLTSPNLQLKDGNGVLWAFDIPPSGSSGIVFTVPLPAGGIVNTPGNSFVIVGANPGSGCTMQINAQFDAA